MPRRGLSIRLFSPSVFANPLCFRGFGAISMARPTSGIPLATGGSRVNANTGKKQVMGQPCMNFKTPRIFVGRIPRGYAGTRKTVALIAQLVREGAMDFCVRQTAIGILRRRGIRAKDYPGEIRALFDWVQRNVRYTRDIHRVELLHTARRMLQLRAGDCDDMTILLSAMLKSIGHPVQLALVGFNPKRKWLFTHIYLEAYCRGDWIPLDPTVNRPMGWAPPADHKLIFPVS
jgi:Transglutaminase-like superfamily